MSASEYDKALLIQDLAKWADDENVLARARKFLDPAVTVPLWGKDVTYKSRSLGDARIANWKKKEKRSVRGVPEGVVEGAALYHCGRPTGLDAVARTKLVAQDVWQVFVVSSEHNEEEQHDGALYRCWCGVRSTAREDDSEVYLTHKTWFTGTTGETPEIVGLPSCKRLREKHEWLRIGDGNELALSIEVAREKPGDYGYRINLKATVEGNKKRTPYEYLGGLSGVPAQRMFLVASLPHSLLVEPALRMPDSKYKRPQCLEFLADGIPTQVIRHFLRGELPRRFVSPWFTSRGEARSWRTGHPALPTAIAAAVEKDGLSLTRSDSETFIVEIEAPAPYLYYSLVFELP